MRRGTVNLLAFQAGWWGCVLAVRSNAPGTALLFTLVPVVLHLALATDRGRQAVFLVSAASIGYAADAVAVWAGALRFASPVPPPPWVAGLWLAFATLLTVALRSLRGHDWRAGIVGAVCGPLMYLAGSRLGIAAISPSTASVALLALAWSAALFAQNRLARVFDRRWASKSAETSTAEVVA